SAFGPRALAPDLAAAGPGQGDRIGAAEAKRLVFAVTGSADAIADARWRVDGTDATGRARVDGGRTELWGSYLRDGEHEVEVVVPRHFPRFGVGHTWRVSIDRTPPRLAVDPASAKAPRDTPLTLRGSVEEASTVSVDGKAAVVDGDTFAVSLPAPPARAVQLVATDLYGNRARKAVRVEVVPRRPPAPLRAVHVTSYAWADRGLHGGVMGLIDEGRIDAVELDLKDESGIVGWDADIPFARRIGSIRPIYDLPTAVALLHRKGIRVVGRIVAFRDPVHAAAAWKRGWKNQVIQTPAGGPYSGYGGFTNFADPVVRQYNIDIARRAAEAGVDEILYDYVRRPDGPIGSMAFPGLVGSPEHTIASFLGEAQRQLKPYGVFLGASVFGIAATRPTEIAQPIRPIARNVDYVAPMVYPSHWAPGEYDVASPNARPYDIVFRSLADFRKQTRGTGARVVPWLQDFTLGVAYGPAVVRAQIRAAARRGIDEWLLWDPLVTYTSDALDRHPLRPPITTKPPAARPLPAPAAAAPPRANELGVVPVLMHHQIRADGGGDYDLTPAELRAELARLWREGYVPIRAADLVSGRIDVPAGKSPVVMTFDDSTKEQLAWDARGQAKPGTAVGIMLAFARNHPGFRPAGTFYVNKEPFGGVREVAEMLRWLHDNGFELGNHTLDHIPFSQLSAREIRR
ncbi:MAG TPA: putative glycoside hydrolase, partial [Solirubrobacteraceae bacterium]